MSGREDSGNLTHVQRLPSFRPPRDLTLNKFNLPNAKANAKKYVPNLNVTRKKVEDSKSSATSTSKENDRKHDGSSPRGRGRGRGRGGNVIQTKSVFSEGMGDRKQAARQAVTERNNSSYNSKPSFSTVGSGVKLKDLSELRDNSQNSNLINDDFVDDPDSYDYDTLKPVSLPLRLSENFCLEEIFDDDEIPPGVKIKSEPGTVNNVKFESKSRMEFSSVPELLSERKPQLIFLQLPTSLPGVVSENMSDSLKQRPNVIKNENASFTPVTIKQEPGLESNQSSKPIASTSNLSAQPAKSKIASDQKSNSCALKDLHPGPIGKLQILKSGKTKLILGNCSFVVDLGSQVGFKQDLVSLDLNADTRTGDSINLGPVTSRLIISPNWEEMLMSNANK